MKGKVGDYILVVNDLYIKEYNGCIGRILKIIWNERELPFQYSVKIFDTTQLDKNEFCDNEIIILKAKTYEDAKDEVMVERL